MIDKKPDNLRLLISIFTGVVSIAVAWGISFQQIADGKEKISDLNTRTTTLENSTNDIKVSIGQIKTILDERLPVKRK